MARIRCLPRSALQMGTPKRSAWPWISFILERERLDCRRERHWFREKGRVISGAFRRSSITVELCSSSFWRREEEDARVPIYLYLIYEEEDGVKKI